MILIIGGKKNGKQTSYFDNNKKDTEYNCVDDVAEGELIQYHRFYDGINYVSIFEKGKLIGYK